MHMRFLISSKAQLPGLVKRTSEPFALFSIHSHDREVNTDPIELHNVHALYHFCFDDVSADFIYFIDQKTIAKLLWLFKECSMIVNTFVIQCESGISRSAAVAVALARICRQSDAFVYDDPRYHPNADVIQAILSAYRADPFPVRGLEPLAKGLFWAKRSVGGSRTLIVKTEPCDFCGKPLDDPDPLEQAFCPKTHRNVWKTFDKRITQGYGYQYYPRGRVEIKNGIAAIYLHPVLCRPEIKNEIQDRFGLYPKNGVRKLHFIADESAHYQCFDPEQLGKTGE